MTASVVEGVEENIPLKAACTMLAAAANDTTGFKWRVRVVEFGVDRNSNYWDKDILTAALDKFEGAKVFALSEGQHQAKAHPFGKSVRDLVGVLHAATVEADGIYADLIILPAATWLRDNLVGCAEHGLSDVIGLSVDISGKLGTKKVENQTHKMLSTINAVTVDVVYDPAAGGQFIKMAAAMQAGQERDSTMDDKKLQEMKLTACRMELQTALVASKLPDMTQAKLQKQFEGKVFELADLQAAIKLEKEYLDNLTASGTISGCGDVRVTREGIDKLQAAFDKTFGVRVDDSLRDVPGFVSLRAAYVEMTGDADVLGVLTPQQARRMVASYGDATFAYALGNAIYRRIVQDYREINDYGVSRVVGSNIRNATNFRPLQSIRIGYYGDLPNVNTDIADYPDLGEVSDEKLEYALQEKGGIITINRRTIINDDLRLVQKIVSRLPRAARRTLARRVFNPFITNSVYGADNKAIFHVDHGNLGTTAYGIAPALAARNAMLIQTEPGSGERLGCCGPTTVMFPVELFGIVSNVNNFNPQAVTVDNGNSMYGYFKPEGLLQQSLLTDANDWYYFADPNECEIVELAFLNGQQEPVMVVADNPAAGAQTFVAGKIQYRINHDYEAAVIDYRGAYKAVVA